MLAQLHLFSCLAARQAHPFIAPVPVHFRCTPTPSSDWVLRKTITSANAVVRANAPRDAQRLRSGVVRARARASASMGGVQPVGQSMARASDVESGLRGRRGAAELAGTQQLHTPTQRKPRARAKTGITPEKRPTASQVQAPPAPAVATSRKKKRTPSVRSGATKGMSQFVRGLDKSRLLQHTEEMLLAKQVQRLRALEMVYTQLQERRAPQPGECTSPHPFL